MILVGADDIAVDDYVDHGVAVDEYVRDFFGFLFPRFWAGGKELVTDLDVLDRLLRTVRP